jgi:hypothetical protein
MAAALLVAWFGARADAGPVNEAADWLLTQQNVNGGFPATVGGPVTTNTQGPTALGMLSAFDLTGNSLYLDSAATTGDYLLTAPAKFSDMDPIFAVHDPLFLELLSLGQFTGDSQYADFVEAGFWSKLTGGTYGEMNDQDAVDFAADLIAARSTASIIGLAPWDLSKTAVAADLAGKDSIKTDLMAGILDALEAAQAFDTSFDLLGLAGAIFASAVTGVDLDPTMGRWASANSTQDLVDELLMHINAAGGWIFQSDVDLNNLDNGDAQVTAAAILALDAFGTGLYDDTIRDGRLYLRSLQQPSGQILRFPSALVNEDSGVQIHGESLTALVPEPTVLVLISVGLIGTVMTRRRRRSRS